MRLLGLRCSCCSVPSCWPVGRPRSLSNVLWATLLSSSRFGGNVSLPLTMCMAFSVRPPDGPWLRLQCYVLDELFFMMLLLGVAQSDLRRLVNRDLWATDATPTAGDPQLQLSLRKRRRLFGGGLSQGASLCAWTGRRQSRRTVLASWLNPRVSRPS